MEDAVFVHDTGRRDARARDRKLDRRVLRPRSMLFGRGCVKNLPGLAGHRAARPEHMPEPAVVDRARVLQIIHRLRVKQWEHIRLKSDLHLSALAIAGR